MASGDVCEESRALGALRPVLLVGAVLAGATLSGCTSTGSQTSASLAAKAGATSDAAYPPLPDTVITVPSAYDTENGPMGSIAEASAVRATEAMAAADQSPDGAPVVVAAAPANANPAADNGAQAEAATPVQVALAATAAGDASLAAAQPASFAGSTPNAPAIPAQPALLSEPADGGVTPISAPEGRVGPAAVGARSAELDGLIASYAKHYDVPEDLVRRVVKRESTFNPKARNGPYWGLMQIRHDTARGMGYRGTAAGLLDAETNLKYAVRYLRGAFLVARGNQSLADRLYQRGYYYDAKRAGLLDETGLGKDRRRRRPSS